MGYHLYLVKIDCYRIPNFHERLENEELLPEFTKEQKEELKSKLLRYNYILTKESNIEMEFEWYDKESGVKARLNNHLVAFSSGKNENGLFEIMQTTSEFIDKSLVKYDIQTGEWEKE